MRLASVLSCHVEHALVFFTSARAIDTALQKWTHFHARSD